MHIIYNKSKGGEVSVENDGLGEILGGDAADLAKEIVERLKAKGETVSFAESCTAGNVCRQIGGVAGASAVFMGGVVSYAVEIKKRILGVDEKIMQKYGVVSEETAVEMARGALNAMKTTWAGAVTGYAGPGGGDEHASVGTVCFAVAHCSGAVRAFRREFEGARGEIVEAATKFLLSKLVELV